jgi:malate synthase
VWQWIRHGARNHDHSPITKSTVSRLLDLNVEKLRGTVPESRLHTAANLYEEMIASHQFPEFLTLRAYDCLD